MSYIPSITLPAFVFNSPAVSILLPLGSSFGIGYATGNTTREQNEALRQPPLSPPSWVFAPVWTVLYSLMGFSAYRAWDVGMSSLDPVMVENTRRGATLYSIQLALNFLFPTLFFGLRQRLAGTVDVIALAGTVGYLTYTWNKVDSVAAYCLLPYLGWVSFASYLSVGICYLNGWSSKGKGRARDQAGGDPKMQ